MINPWTEGLVEHWKTGDDFNCPTGWIAIVVSRVDGFERNVQLAIENRSYVVHGKAACRVIAHLSLSLAPSVSMPVPCIFFSSSSYLSLSLAILNNH